MTTFLLLIEALSLAAAAAAFVFLAIAASRFLTGVERQGLLLRVVHTPMATSQSPGPPGEGYAVYMWSAGRWRLETDFSQPGYETTPPTMAGSYEGQLVRKEAVRR